MKRNLLVSTGFEMVLGEIVSLHGALRCGAARYQERITEQLRGTNLLSCRPSSVEVIQGNKVSVYVMRTLTINTRSFSDRILALPFVLDSRSVGTSRDNQNTTI